MYNHAMAGWLRTFFILFALVHIAIIAANQIYGPFDPFANQQELTEYQVAMGSGFYGILFGLMTFGWLILWTIVFLLLRDRARRAERRKPD